MLNNAQVLLEVTGGDAVIEVDYVISTGLATKASVGTAPASLTIPLIFQPGEQTKPLTIQVLNNPARTEPRTLELTLTTAGGASIGAPSSLTLTLLPSPVNQPGEPDEPGEPAGYRIYLPLTRGN